MRALLLSLLLATAAHAQTLGLFEGQSDIGTLLHPGAADFDPTAKTYTLTSSGENMWAAEDDFHFVWKKVSGDVTITAVIAFPATTGNAHKKGALMIRRTLDADSDYVDAALHLAGLTSLQSRDRKGGITREVQSYIPSPKKMRLVKSGNNVFMYVAGDDGVFHFSGGSMKLQLDEPFYIGIAACAHDKDASEKVTFSQLELSSAPVPAGKTLYSTLEAQTSDRRALWVEKGRIESPRFSPDGKSILYTLNGKLWRIAAAGGGRPEPATADESAPLQTAHPDTPYEIPTDEFENTNPQLSPDARQVVFLSRDSAGMRIRALSLATKAIAIKSILPDGGELGPNPWSPDSRTLTYVSYQYPPQ